MRTHTDTFDTLRAHVAEERASALTLLKNLPKAAMIVELALDNVMKAIDDAAGASAKAPARLVSHIPRGMSAFDPPAPEDNEPHAAPAPKPTPKAKAKAEAKAASEAKAKAAAEAKAKAKAEAAEEKAKAKAEAAEEKARAKAKAAEEKARAKAKAAEEKAKAKAAAEEKAKAAAEKAEAKAARKAPAPPPDETPSTEEELDVSSGSDATSTDETHTGGSTDESSENESVLEEEEDTVEDDDDDDEEEEEEEGPESASVPTSDESSDEAAALAMAEAKAAKAKAKPAKPAKAKATKAASATDVLGGMYVSFCSFGHQLKEETRRAFSADDELKLFTAQVVARKHATHCVECRAAKAAWHAALGRPPLCITFANLGAALPAEHAEWLDAMRTHCEACFVAGTLKAVSREQVEAEAAAAQERKAAAPKKDKKPAAPKKRASPEADSPMAAAGTPGPPKPPPKKRAKPSKTAPPPIFRYAFTHRETEATEEQAARKAVTELKLAGFGAVLADDECDADVFITLEKPDDVLALIKAEPAALYHFWCGKLVVSADHVLDAPTGRAILERYGWKLAPAVARAEVEHGRTWLVKESTYDPTVRTFWSKQVGADVVPSPYVKRLGEFIKFDDTGNVSPSRNIAKQTFGLLERFTADMNEAAQFL